MTRRYSSLLFRPAVILIVAAWAASPLSWAELDSISGAEAAKKSAHLYAQGNLAGAVQVLRHAITVHPEDPQLHFMLANALFRQQAWSGAIHHYSEAARLRPQHSDTYLGLGYAYYQAERVDEAVSAWRAAVRQSPHDALPHLSLAVGLSAGGYETEARQHAARALDLDPHWQQRIIVDIRWTQEMVQRVHALIGQIQQAHTALTPGGQQ
jgi:tetratricopeptide (TPR) repeat protein